MGSFYRQNVLFSLFLFLFLSISQKLNNADMLKFTNYYRCLHGNPPLEWDNSLAALAQKWAYNRQLTANCSMEHSHYGPGENVAEGFNAWPSECAVVSSWYHENFTYGTNSPDFLVSGHFSQIVWMGTQKLGCAWASCESNGHEFWVCQYAPPGNIVGNYIPNVPLPCRNSSQCLSLLQNMNLTEKFGHYNLTEALTPNVDNATGYDYAENSCVTPVAAYLDKPVGNATYMGCFPDPNVTNRDLPFLASNSTNQTIQACSTLCTHYLYFGLQNGDECWCGNSFGHHGTSNSSNKSDCNRNCSGSELQICGGTLVNSVYLTPGVQSPYLFIGCFADNTTLRDLPLEVTNNVTYFNLLKGTNIFNNLTNLTNLFNLSVIDISLPNGGNNSNSNNNTNTNVTNALLQLRNNLTLDLCAELCTGYLYFGVSNGSRCFCGNSFGRYGNASSSCSAPCNGNASQICGGPGVNSIYLTPDPETPYPYLGCYTNLTFLANNQTSTNQTSTNQTSTNQTSTNQTLMTLSTCAALCVGYRYFGIQNGTQCWCGEASFIQYVSSTNCNMTCSGNSSEMCGNEWASSVYLTPVSICATNSTNDGVFSLNSTVDVTLGNLSTWDNPLFRSESGPLRAFLNCSSNQLVVGAGVISCLPNLTWSVSGSCAGKIQSYTSSALRSMPLPSSYCSLLSFLILPLVPTLLLSSCSLH